MYAQRLELAGKRFLWLNYMTKKKAGSTTGFFMCLKVWNPNIPSKIKMLALKKERTEEKIPKCPVAVRAMG